MAHLFNNRRSRVNPVEVFVFLLVLAIFAHSGYRLLFDWKGIHEVHHSTDGQGFVYHKDGQPAFAKDRQPAAMPAAGAPGSVPAPAAASASAPPSKTR